ncbi:MAG: HNH endonuclease signature motif containing protein, partial [Acidimicrobiales bacterium]
MEKAALERCSDDELATGISRLHAVEQATRRQLLSFIAEYGRREAWRADGASSIEEWLVQSLSVTRSSAVDLVRVATKLVDLPALASAYEDGHLSWDQLRPVVGVASATTDAYVASEAPRYSADQCRDLARQLRRVKTGDAVAAHRHRNLRFWWDDQCLRLSGRLADSEGAAVVKALTHLADQAAPDETDGVYAPFDSRCADALTQLASSYLSLNGDADRASVVVHVDAAALAGADGHARIEDGPDIAVATARRLACDTRWQLLSEKPDGQAVGVGRTTRSVPPWLVRQLKRRDGGCRFTGCHRSRWLHAHHIVHWADGGPTDPDNLVMLCGS